MVKRTFTYYEEKSILKDEEGKEVLDEETRTLMNILFIVDYVKAVIDATSLIVTFIVSSNHNFSNNSFEDFKDLDKMIELFQEKVKETLPQKKKK